MRPQITVIGRIGKTPESRTTQSGTRIVSFSVATGKESETLWFDVSCFGKSADYAENYLDKGRLVAVTGTFSKREYDGKTYLQISANEVSGLDRPRDDAQPQTAQAPAEDEYDPWA